MAQLLAMRGEEATMAGLDHPVEGTLRRADGRRIAYTRSGEPEGRPVLFCHGTPGARLFRPPDPHLPAELGVELVTVDRPGYGRSTRWPGRSLLDWADDVAALADELSWPRFSVAGVSGGGPHAMACAVALPERVAAVGAISSVAPFWPGALEGMLPGERSSGDLAAFDTWIRDDPIHRDDTCRYPPANSATSTTSTTSTPTESRCATNPKTSPSLLTLPPRSNCVDAFLVTPSSATQPAVRE